MTKAGEEEEREEEEDYTEEENIKEKRRLTFRSKQKLARGPELL